MERKSRTTTAVRRRRLHRRVWICGTSWWLAAAFVELINHVVLDYQQALAGELEIGG